MTGILAAEIGLIEDKSNVIDTFATKGTSNLQFLVLS
jgi:hypothetical protein